MLGLPMSYHGWHSTDILTGSPTVFSSVVSCPGFAGLNWVRQISEILVPHPFLYRCWSLRNILHLGFHLDNNLWQFAIVNSVGVQGRGYVCYKKKKGQNSWWQRGWNSTATTMGSFVSNNKQVTQRSKILSCVLGGSLWVPTLLGLKSPKHSKVTSSYS